ncbi:MAG: hypothetical protein EOP51_02465 [Sphingobacteriales bacterium]|nr:MAG: hypothetical protein EOP51_02465 [Sphingobacteriales bacterium]
MNNPARPEVTLPNYRWIENAHIFLWLIKDLCWSAEFKPGGIVMIVPTVSVAFYLLWRVRHDRQEAVHNLAVCFWILANSVWMLGEFFDHDMRPIAATLFGTGILIILAYYLTYFRKDKKKQVEENDKVVVAEQSIH